MIVGRSKQHHSIPAMPDNCQIDLQLKLALQSWMMNVLRSAASSRPPSPADQHLRTGAHTCLVGARDELA